MAENQRLGKGLAALISADKISNSSGAYNENFEITRIAPNPYQPRMHINPEELIQIADSIKEHGIIQPLIITKDDGSDKYFLIAGERRYRAAQLAGLKTVPVVIKDASPQQMLELALIENIQRQDLNPLEEAVAFKQLQEEFSLTQSAIAKKVGLSRVAITNKIRLLGLPEEVKEAVLNEKLSEGHARALLGITDSQSLVAAASIVMRRGLSVRETEHMVRKINYGKTSSKQTNEEVAKYVTEMSKKLSSRLGYTAQIMKLTYGGKIIIRYNTGKELDEILKKMGV
ncbi:MAG: ParB-like protein partition protein [candidate division WS6 bacterium GW2011_GWF2_39_15]|uniref:ParB-like protein partition protein n=1 Tax=candidate division WS6 bacterium GW2011_GWF2_39_15 TaxID=1619100 RepID=A0A0G0Q6K1_9BACT|nr:MAG: ParB-like protein partition protein [candidate division WS6 bacterium GW2011_GWF2_39_15]